MFVYTEKYHLTELLITKFRIKYRQYIYIYSRPFSHLFVASIDLTKISSFLYSCSLKVYA